MRRRKLIVGLGNPGPEYVHNRHNAGFQFLDRFAEKHGLPFDFIKFKALLALGEVEGQEVILAKPLTFMNLSGTAVKPLMSGYKIEPEDLLVVYDDLDLPLGKLRLRPRGGSGGHKGMESIIQALGHEEFPRLRLGIGRPADSGVVDYVLSDFSESEMAVMEKVYELAIEVVEVWLKEGMEAATKSVQGGKL